MGGSGHHQDRQAARDLLVDLVGEVLPQVRAGVGADGEKLARLYVLRDQARTARLGSSGAAVAGWLGRAAALVRDEADDEQAVQLLRRAADQLAAIVDLKPQPGSRPPADHQGPEHRCI